MFQGHKTTLRQKIAIANLSWQLSYGKKAHISDQSEHHLKNSCYLLTHIETTYFQTICNKGTDVIVLDTHPLDHGDSPFCSVSLSCLIGGSLILRPLVGFSRSGMLQIEMRKWGWDRCSHSSWPFRVVLTSCVLQQGLSPSQVALPIGDGEGHLTSSSLALGRAAWLPHEPLWLPCIPIFFIIIPLLHSSGFILILSVPSVSY